MLTEGEARMVWRSTDAVCLDVDSTVIQKEAVDQLARFLNKDQQITDITRKAMSGGVSFNDSLKQRLNILLPDQTSLTAFLAAHTISLSMNVRELVSLLHERSIPVYLVSGGFRCLINPVANSLHIPLDHVFANTLLFNYEGSYWGFDESEPTSRSGGKAEVVRSLMERKGYQRVVMIGDGATDAEAAPPASLFIGYGGNVVRDAVKSRTPWFITDFQELINEMNAG